MLDAESRREGERSVDELNHRLIWGCGIGERKTATAETSKPSTRKAWVRKWVWGYFCDGLCGMFCGGFVVGTVLHRLFS